MACPRPRGSQGDGPHQLQVGPGEFGGGCPVAAQWPQQAVCGEGPCCGRHLPVARLLVTGVLHSCGGGQQVNRWGAQSPPSQPLGALQGGTWGGIKLGVLAPRLPGPEQGTRVC